MKSFDLFDTLITRDVAYPADIFYFLGRRLFSRGLLAIDPENFHQKRVLAERVARRKKLKEVTIEEIYLEMTSLIEVRHSQLSEFIEEERVIEKNSFDIIHQNTKKLTSESIVVSDFYIGKDFLEEVMRFLKLPFKDIFVSADYKTTKYHGGLFDKVLMQYPISEHIGDNEHSDYRMPLKKNIFAIFYKDSILTSYERLIREDICLNLFERSLISGAMKRARLSKSFDNDSDTVKHNVASNVIAPFLFDYVFFILKKAVENNIQNLYFVARDGQILYKLAEVILTAYDFPIRIKYLYGSRKAWHLAAVKDVDDYVLEWIFDNTDQLRLSDICSRCEISKDELPLFIKERFQDDINLSSKDRRDLREIFASDMCVKNLILRSAKNKKDIVLDYLKQEGFSSDKNIGIVDVGWRARQQRSLSELLKEGGIYPNGGLKGFYVSLINPVQPIAFDQYFCYFDKSHSKIIRFSALYEIFVAADHGSCVGYKRIGGDVKPQLRELNNEKMLNWGLLIQQAGILNYAVKVCDSFIKYNVDYSSQKDLSYKLLNKFFYSPHYSEVSIYGELSVFEDQEESISHKLAKSVSPYDFTLHFLKIGKRNHNLWLEGSVVLTKNRFFKAIFSLLLKVKNLLRGLL